MIELVIGLVIELVIELEMERALKSEAFLTLSRNHWAIQNFLGFSPRLNPLPTQRNSLKCSSTDSLDYFPGLYNNLCFHPPQKLCERGNGNHHPDPFHCNHPKDCQHRYRGEGDP